MFKVRTLFHYWLCSFFLPMVSSIKSVVLSYCYKFGYIFIKNDSHALLFSPSLS